MQHYMQRQAEEHNQKALSDILELEFTIKFYVVSAYLNTLILLLNFDAMILKYHVCSSVNPNIKIFTVK